MIDKTVFSVNIWDVFQKEGKAALEKGDLDTAATDFKRALEKAERESQTEGCERLSWQLSIFIKCTIFLFALIHA